MPVSRFVIAVGPPTLEFPKILLCIKSGGCVRELTENNNKLVLKTERKSLNVLIIKHFVIAHFNKLALKATFYQI